MFKQYLKLFNICFIFMIIISCSSMQDIYNYQRPTNAEECYDIIVDVKDNYDTNMFLIREEKLDGINVKSIYNPARELLISWDKSVELLGIYINNKTDLNKKKLYDSINDLKLKQRNFLTVSNKILGMDIVQ